MDIKQIIRIYENRIGSIKTKGISDFASLQKYARRTGKTLADIIAEYVDIPELTEEDATQLFMMTLKANHDEVVRVFRQVQRSTNREAGVNLGILDADFNSELARDIARTIVDSQQFTREYVENLVVNHSNKVVDESMRLNAEAQSNVGLNVHISRKYDDVGLHGGKDTCQWCMDRQGEWDNYQGALAAGAFERHPGCGCVIEYEVGKTHTWSNSLRGWKNM